MNIINELNKKHGVAVILVTNSFDDLNYADNIVALKDGCIVFSGNSKKLTKTILKRAGLND